MQGRTEGKGEAKPRNQQFLHFVQVDGFPGRTHSTEIPEAPCTGGGKMALPVEPISEHHL